MNINYIALALTLVISNILTFVLFTTIEWIIIKKYGPRMLKNYIKAFTSIYGSELGTKMPE